MRSILILFISTDWHKNKHKYVMAIRSKHAHLRSFFLVSVVAKKLGCRLQINLRRLKEGLKCLLCFTDSSPAKNPAGNRRFFSR